MALQATKGDENTLQRGTISVRGMEEIENVSPWKILSLHRALQTGFFAPKLSTSSIA